MIEDMKQKTAAVYDRWLSTLGGGEQVAFAYAHTLMELGYKVHLITHKKVDIEKAEKKMGISLDNIELIYLTENSTESLPGYSEKYDVFINCSHLDYFANRAKLGILCVFFPGIIKFSPYEYLKRALFIPSFQKFFIYPSRYEGFLYDQLIDGKIYKWLSTKSEIVFKDDIDSLRLDIYFENFTFSVTDQITFYLDDEQITDYTRALRKDDNVISYQFKLSNTKNKRLIINLPDNEYSKKVALISLTIPNIRYMLYNMFKKMFPLWEMRLHGGPGVTKRSDIESYDKIVTISEFCRKWINNYWGLASQVLYPPVNTEEFSPAKKKKNHIIHIGRFFVTGHSKKQLDLVKVFKRMVSQHNVDDWELHFIGSIYEGSRHQAYFDKCKAEAEGYNISFHTHADFEELKTRLSEAKIYWHATGLDEQEEKDPIVFEHFGITTVEAMASGCVPVVINAGGQKEIVTKESGFLWNNRKELMNYTHQLIADSTLYKQLQKGSLERSDFFSRKLFKKRFGEMIEHE
jgi:glycosyltransferase involved in cell wall biosynthesis